ncbi:phytanoyl-CoA dioxygenase family protein [Cyclobacterium salsum]|uniref:phytanoyl-CoA dioxygenase family protein n=1 Tax=Cyclobacterium salsum TaxID=2666329 RepID=UPI0013912BA9|nr:phytanoyl-CoA dioxygenase family protein [Cyclobacterium salsum]
MIATLKRIKWLYVAYNFFHQKKLAYLKPLYARFGVRKRCFQTISSSDLNEYDPLIGPVLDRLNSVNELPSHPLYADLPEKIQEELLHWSDDGYAVLEGFFTGEQVASINDRIEKLVKSSQLEIREGRKIMFAVNHSPKLRAEASPGRLEKILEMVLGRPVSLFQSVNFYKGSEDPAHSDFIHMSTYPYGFLIAVWIALEDIDMDNGPLFYYPGSHKLKYIMNNDFDHGGNNWMLGKNYKEKYSNKIASVLADTDFKIKYFTAKKGDVLIWHANLLHGGAKVVNGDRTRKSMVMHYFGSDVIRYHEVTQRPSLMN